MAQLRVEEEGSQQHPIGLNAPVHLPAGPMNTVGRNETQVGDKAANESPPPHSTVSIASESSRSLLNAGDMVVTLDKILTEPDPLKEGTHTLISTFNI